MFLDQKIVLEEGTTDRYANAVLNPDGSLIGGGSMASSLYTQLIDYDGGVNPVYIGEATAGSLGSEGSNIWRIKKLTYDVNDNVIVIAWADGNNNFDNIWNDRATLIYS